MSVQFTRTSHSLAVDGSRLTLCAWLTAGFLLSGWLLWFCQAPVAVYEISREARLEVEQAAHPVTTSVAGKIEVSHLLIGRDVQAGEVLVVLDTAAERLRVQEEQARLDSLPTQITALRSEIAAREAAGSADRGATLSGVQTARAKLQEAAAAADFAVENAKRLGRLQQTGRIAEVEALRAEAEAKKLTSAASGLATDIRRLEQEGTARSHAKRAELDQLRREAAELEGQQATLQASLIRLRQELEQRTIRAAVAGRVADSRPLPSGAYVAAGEKLASLVPSGALRIVAQFPPVAVLGRIREGQSARLRLDGFPWAQYGAIEATVSRVASEIRDNNVRVEFTPQGRQLAGLTLQHGLPGAIEVEIERTTPALLALRAAGQTLVLPANTLRPNTPPS